MARWHRVLAGFALLALVAEAGARAGVRAWAGVPFRSLAPYRWSPYGLVRNNPDLSSPGFRINRNGFRNVEDFQPRRPAGTLRVMILGGSVAYSGLGGVPLPGARRVGSDETVAAFLERSLRGDPALAGVKVEVVNAAVNFNRIPEVCDAYLAEYAHWDPDVVIVMGSANNFPCAPPAGAVRARRFGFQEPHPWALEFERQVNGTGPAACGERLLAAAGEHLACVALARQALPLLTDGATAFAAGQGTGRDAGEPCPPAEADAYVDEYLGYADAMTAMARNRGQDIAFFWEYFLAHLDGLRPLEGSERFLFDANRQASMTRDRAFNFAARDRVAGYLRQAGIPFLDPLETLRSAPGCLYIDYLHYTPEGNRVVAGFLHRELSETFRRRAGLIRQGLR